VPQLMSLEAPCTLMPARAPDTDRGAIVDYGAIPTTEVSMSSIDEEMVLAHLHRFG